MIRMANAVVDWGGAKPSITYGPMRNWAWVRRGSIDSVEVEGTPSFFIRRRRGKRWNRGKWETRGIHTVEQKEGHHQTWGLDNLGPSLYHWTYDGAYAKLLKKHLDSICDVMVILHVGHIGLERREGKRKKKSQLLEPCEINSNEDWLQERFTP